MVSEHIWTCDFMFFCVSLENPNVSQMKMALHHMLLWLNIYLSNHSNVQDLAVQAERLSEQLRRYQVNILYYFLAGFLIY
jgi:hypothetical protein